MTNFYVVRHDDNDVFCYDCSDMETWPFFRRVAAELAMDDCSGIQMLLIVYQNKEYRYVGWRPGMEYTFVNVNDPDDFYTTYMKHLDH